MVIYSFSLKFIALLNAVEITIMLYATDVPDKLYRKEKFMSAYFKLLRGNR